MRYSVPQFIDVEDKVVGPLTIRQFGYIVAGAASVFLVWAFFGISVLFFLLSLPLIALFASLAFLKINGRPFQVFIGSFIRYVTGGTRLWIWRRSSESQQINIEVEEKQEEEQAEERIFPKSSIQKIVEVLDTGMSTRASTDLEMLEIAGRVRATRKDLES